MSRIAPAFIPAQLRSCLIFALLTLSTTIFFNAVAARAFTIHRSAGVGLRTYPFSATADAGVKFERLVWDKRAESNSEWKFGMAQGRVGVATHGLLDVGVAFYPISIFELAFSTSKTFRFYETKPFDCDILACAGELNRATQSARFVLGHKLTSFDVFMIPSLSVSKIHQSGKESDRGLAVDEVEKLILDSSGDQLTAKSVMFGLKKDEWTYVLLARDAKYESNERSNQMVYLVVRKEIEKMRVQAGIGQYGSDYQAKKFSAILSASWNFDEKSQSLF